MRRGTSRSFVRPDTGSSLLRRMEDPEPPSISPPPPPPAAPPPSSAPAEEKSDTEVVARDDIFSRISTSSVVPRRREPTIAESPNSVKPPVANRRSFSNTRVGSHTTVKSRDASKEVDDSKADNVSGKISLAYSIVSVDSVDSVDTVNSVRINETRADTVSGADGSSVGGVLAPPPIDSFITRRSSSATNGGSATRSGSALVSPSASASFASTSQTTLKKKPEVKAKPKISKVIPKVVPKVSTKIMTPSVPVGLKSLPKQLHRRAMRRGFEFTLMVVGESGLGKSTLVNSMFLTDIYKSKLGKVPRPEQTLEVDHHAILLEEGGVALSLTVLDTPGFGDKLDNSSCWHPVSSYVEDQFDKFLEAETRVDRVKLVDTRIHACLYFIAPNGHKLKELDLEFMKRLCEKVNLIPVIGKSDCLTKEELADFKKKILEQIEDNNIKIYNFNIANNKDKWMTELAPFAVVGSNSIIQDASGKKVRGRSYPWGCVNIEERQHCDFQALRTLLLAHGMQDLVETTSQQHYENYRTSKLKEVQNKNKITDDRPNKNPLASLEDEKLEHDQKVLQMTLDMEAVFRRKVEEKGEKMKRTEQEELEKIGNSRKEMEEVKSSLERRREELLEEKRSWERENNISLANVLLAGSTDSLGTKKKKHSLTVNPFKFGRT